MSELKILVGEVTGKKTDFVDNTILICESAVPDKDGYTPIDGKIVIGEASVKKNFLQRTFSL